MIRGSPIYGRLPCKTGSMTSSKAEDLRAKPARSIISKMLNLAMLWELTAKVERNPMELVTVEGVTKRQKRKSCPLNSAVSCFVARVGT